MRTLEHDIHGSKSGLHDRVMALKQQQRLKDAMALEAGRLSAAEINRKNGRISGRNLKLDLTSGGRLR